MAIEPSSTSYNAASQSPSPAPDSYVGCFISVTSKSEIRYEGFIYYLNPQDSSLGLRDVRSHGTEGRTRNGKHIPPSDKVYEYIVFRGSDIKDLQVKPAPSLPAKDPVYNDPAVIQSNNYVDSSRSSKSVPVTGSSYNLYSESSALDAQSYPSMFPSHHSGTKLGTWDFSLSEHTTASSYGIPTGPAQWQGYSRAPGSIITGDNQHYLPSTTELYPMQNPASTMMAMTNLQPSPPFHHSTLINSNGLTMPFSLNHQGISNPADQVLNKAVTHPISVVPVQSLPYSTSVVDSISEPSVRQQQTLSTPNIAQLRLSENSPGRNSYTDQKDVGGISSTSLNFSSPASLSVQLNHLPLPPPSQTLQCPSQYNEEFDMEAMNEKFKKGEVCGHLGKPHLSNKVEGIRESLIISQVTRDDNSDSVSKSEPKLLHTSQFTEEFDFQAMNEKFNKDEIWEYLGKVNHSDEPEGIHENGTGGHVSRDDAPHLVSNKDRKPAYNKDDFFDSISGNSEGNGARNGQNQSSQRQKSDYEPQTFGNSRRRTHPAYGGHRAGRGGHAQHSWGRGYNYHYRGRGGYRQR